MPIYRLKLISREEVAMGTFVFKFDKPQGFSFVPGQYGGFTLINPHEADQGGITRRFSLVSTPHDPYLAIATRLQPNIPHSTFKKELDHLEIGKEIKFAGPTGNFVLKQDPHIPVVFIAGGIGIAPFYSMIKNELLEKTGRKMQLFYGNQAMADAAFLSELQSLQSTNFSLIAALNNPPSRWEGETGFLTEAILRKHIKGLNEPYYYVCGSPVMVTALQEILAEMGVDEDRIQTEDFPGYP